MDSVNSNLTVENPKWKEAVDAGRSTRGILPVIKNFTVDYMGGLHIPRGYSQQLFTDIGSFGIVPEIIDKRSVVPFDRIYNHSIQLRDYQVTALTEVSKFAEGLLIAPAGSGKTVMGIALSLMCNQKYLWLTHTKELLHQFIDRVQAFTDVGEDEIGIVAEGKWDLGKPITVGLVQTMVKNADKLEEIQNSFGTIIVDECHHVPATTFTNIISSLNPFYLFGLTATPERRDKLHSLMFHNLGPARFVIPRSAVADKVITPLVIPRHINNTPMAESYQKLLIALAEDENRNNFIAADVIREAKAGNICIVSSERVSHAEALYNIIKKEWPQIDLVVGKIKKEDRKEALRKLNNNEITVLVCTSHLLGEGFDYAPLNRLFITLPFRNIARCEQLVGRVQRSCEGKTDAWIFDYIDNHSLAQHQFKNKTGKDCRYNVYKKLGCKFTE